MWTVLKPSERVLPTLLRLLLQEQMGEKTVFEVTVGLTIHHTRKRTTSSYRRSAKHTKCPTTYSPA